jgi:putative transposase
MTILPSRKPNRLEGYDYSLNGAYFVTICAKDRTEIFSHITESAIQGRPQVRLTEIGKCVYETILAASHGDVTIDRYVIMPNHIHMIVVIHAETGDRGRSPLQIIVRNIKSFVTKQIGYSPWQKSFHDHIIRNEKDHVRIAEYIENNPVMWEGDCFNPLRRRGDRPGRP